MEAHWQRNYFCIAEHHVSVRFRTGQGNSMALLPSFEPFRMDSGEDCVMDLAVDDDLPPLPKERRTRVRTCETGNGDTIVDQIDGEGGYQFIIKDVRGRSCCLLIADADFTHCRCALNGDSSMRAFGLSCALVYSYSFSTCGKQTLLIHASLVRHAGYGYAFIAKSGTGKSTQVAMWLRSIPGCDLMNDDHPIVRLQDGTAYIYGSPWSGKTPCYRGVKARLGAITQIDRAQTNSVERLQPLEAFIKLIHACSSMKWDTTLYGHVCDTISRLIAVSDVYTLHCLPNEEAARVCYEAIAKR